MISIQSMILEIGVLIILYMTIAFILALIKKDNSIADIFWGPGFVLVAVYSVIQSGEADIRKMIVCVLVLLWGLRLSYHIWVRNRGKGEDSRYRTWRETWKFFVLRSYFQVFLLQGLFMLIISAPLWYIGFSRGGVLGGWDFLGMMVFGAGFITEVMSDAQLATFRDDPGNRGKIMTEGLWSMSRHPNYFGEALLWWGLGCYALSLPDGWMFLAGPLVITLLLRYVSGVPMLEKHFDGRPGWEEYKASTAPFIPFVHFF